MTREERLREFEAEIEDILVPAALRRLALEDEWEAARSEKEELRKELDEVIATGGPPAQVQTLNLAIAVANDDQQLRAQELLDLKVDVFKALRKAVKRGTKTLAFEDVHWVLWKSIRAFGMSKRSAAFSLVDLLKELGFEGLPKGPGTFPIPAPLPTPLTPTPTPTPGFLPPIPSVTPTPSPIPVPSVPPGGRLAGASGTSGLYASAWLGEAVSDIPLESLLTTARSKDPTIDAVVSDSALSGQTLGSLQGGAIGGPLGVLATALAALIMRSEGFAKLLEAAKSVVQSVADTLGTALNPIIPLVQGMGRALRPLLDAITPLLLMMVRLSPQFLLLTLGVRLLAPALQRLAAGITFVVGSITQTIVGFLQIVRKLMKKLGLKTKAIDNLIKAVKEATAPIEELAETAASVSEELINAPDGFKLASIRFMATTAIGSSAPGGLLTNVRAGERVVNLRVVSGNPERMWGQFRKLLERDNYRATGTPLGIVTPFGHSTT